MKTAIVGAGVMGANHVRIGMGNPRIDVVAVVDPDTERTAPLVDRYGVAAVRSLNEVLDEVEAVIIAAPTRLHHELGRQVLVAGKHVLIEKPIAAAAHEAEDLVALAASSGCVLTVGHVERFNPAVRELPNVLQDPVHIEVFRIGPFSSRVPEDVVLDLMIHDLDIVLSIAKSPVVYVGAVGQRRRTSQNDLVTALVRFESGVTAALTASRIGQQKIRSLRITQAASMISIDLLRQQIEINRVDHIEYADASGRRYRQTGVVEIPFVENRGEPLALELDEFERAVRTGSAPEVSGTDGLLALTLALSIIEAAG
jgi:predicted dehydrogenase